MKRRLRLRGGSGDWNMDNILYKSNRMVLLARYDDPAMHRHFAKHLIVSDQPFVYRTDGGSILTRSVVVSSNTAHHIESGRSAAVVVFLIDETSGLSRALETNCLKGRSEAVLNADAEREMIRRIDAGCALEELDQFAVRTLLDPGIGDRQMDSRISAAIRLIESLESIDSEIYDSISGQIFLSKSRFLHLFKAEMDIDFKNYLLLKKLEKAYGYVTQRRMSITEAAILAGFSSASHFSTACKQHYGLSLSSFLKAQKAAGR